MWSSFPREPGVAGGKSDFRFTFIGPVEAGQGNLMPPDVRLVDLRVHQIDAYIHPNEDAPTGQDMILAVYVNGVELDQITIPEDTLVGTPVTIDPLFLIEAGDIVTADILQTGNGRRGGTVSLFLRTEA